MKLTDRERRVIEVMRSSEMAEQALYKYANAFAPDTESLSSKSMSERWGDEYAE